MEDALRFLRSRMRDEQVQEIGVPLRDAVMGKARQGAVSELARQMTTKGLYLLVRERTMEIAPGQKVQEAETAAQPAPLESKKTEAPEKDTFPPNVAQKAQAKTLVSAAQSGVPFCEECEKLKQEQAA